MLRHLLSDDLPRSRVLAAMLAATLAALALAPFLFPGTRSLNVAAKICVFIVLVASYDLLLGYTGIVSFAHTMFYGIGSYAIAIALYAMGPTWAGVATGIVIGLPLAALLALCIGLFSLRVQAIFFAMITLAVASAFLVLASQLSRLTGGDDGRSFRLPELLRPGTVLISKDVLGFEFNGRTLTYYIVFFGAAAMILTLLRIVNSPFGRVIQAIRENESRMEAVGYPVFRFKLAAFTIAGALGGLAGALLANQNSYVNPGILHWTESGKLMIMVILGGVGHLYGGIIGAIGLLGLEELLANHKIEWLAAMYPNYQQHSLLAVGVVLLVVVLYAPQGIAGLFAPRNRK